MLDLLRPWPLHDVVCIDTETTGVGPDDRAVEVAAVRFSAFREVARFSSLVNPGMPIPEAATAVHGITDRDVERAPRMSEIAPQLAEMCAGAIPCAYNAPFDRGMLAREPDGFDPGARWIDVFVMIAALDRYATGPGRHKLAQACRRWGVRLKSAHRAYGDASATGRLLYRLFDANRIRPVSMAALLEHTERMRAWHEHDHARYRLKCQRRAAHQELSELFTDTRQGYEIRKVGTDDGSEQDRAGVHASGSDGGRDRGGAAADYADCRGGQGAEVLHASGAPVDRAWPTADHEPEQPPGAHPPESC